LAAVNPFLFVVGCPRSGTTLLGRMIDAHPEVAVIHEGRFVTDLLDRADRRGSEEPVVGPALVDALLEPPYSKNVRVAREDLERLVESEEHLPYASFVRGVFDLHGKAHGKRLVGDKTPHYVRSLPELHELWPRAKFVHLIRDGRDVCLSTMGWRKVAARGGAAARFSPWKEDPVSTVALWWEWQVRLGREAGDVLGPELYRELRYEALVADPERECQALCSFLGVAYDERMLSFHEGRMRDDPALDAKKAWRPVTPGLRNWRSELPAEDVARFEAAAGGLLDELGYRRGAGDADAETAERATRLRRSFARDIERRRHRRLPARWGG
jgi:Sulfotransferase family